MDLEKLEYHDTWWGGYYRKKGNDDAPWEPIEAEGCFVWSGDPQCIYDTIEYWDDPEEYEFKIVEFEMKPVKAVPYEVE